MKSSIKLHMNGAHDRLLIDGHEFDRSRMTNGERRSLADTIKEALFGPHVANARPRRNRRGKGSR